MNKFLTLAATSLAALQMQVVAQDTRPNIIYIMSDDRFTVYKSLWKQAG